MNNEDQSTQLKEVVNVNTAQGEISSTYKSTNKLSKDSFNRHLVEKSNVLKSSNKKSKEKVSKLNELFSTDYCKDIHTQLDDLGSRFTKHLVNAKVCLSETQSHGKHWPGSDSLQYSGTVGSYKPGEILHSEMRRLSRDRLSLGIAEPAKLSSSSSSSPKSCKHGNKWRKKTHKNKHGKHAKHSSGVSNVKLSNVVQMVSLRWMEDQMNQVTHKLAATTMSKWTVAREIDNAAAMFGE